LVRCGAFPTRNERDVPKVSAPHIRSHPMVTVLCSSLVSRVMNKELMVVFFADPLSLPVGSRFRSHEMGVQQRCSLSHGVIPTSQCGSNNRNVFRSQQLRINKMIAFPGPLRCLRGICIYALLIGHIHVTSIKHSFINLIPSLLSSL